MIFNLRMRIIFNKIYKKFVFFYNLLDILLFWYFLYFFSYIQQEDNKDFLLQKLTYILKPF